MPTNDPSNVHLTPASLNGNANLLLELAGVLSAGRPDEELSRRGQAPAGPQEVSDEILRFAGFAGDQFQDLFALLAALSTKVATASGTYQGTDRDNADEIDRYLAGGSYVPPGKR